MLAGCGSGSQPSLAPPGSVSASLLQPAAATPPACRKQKKTNQYASAAEKLSTKNRSLCIPAFDGFGGTLNYAGMTTSAKVTVTSSTTNYAGIPPPQPSGSVIFYLNLASSDSTTFGSKPKRGGGLTSKSIKANSTYSALLEGYAFGFWHSGLASCYAVAKPGKYGGVIGGLGSVLNGQQFAGIGYTQFEIFIYQGQYGGKC